MKKRMQCVITMLMVLAMVLGFVPVFEHYAQAAETAQSTSFAGKKVSILGDSISTFEGVSNNTAYNSTIGGNWIYYTDGLHGVSLHDTWWQQIIDTLDMELCVNNSWSGSKISMDTAGNAAYKDRCVQLHNNKGETPDYIWVYLGTNDYTYSDMPWGTAAAINTSKLFVKSGNGYTYANPKTVCEAYAIMLHKSMQRYPNAEIYCLGMLAREKADGNLTSANAQLEAVAGLLGVSFVQLESISATPEDHRENMGNELHPNTEGMDRISDLLIKAMQQDAAHGNSKPIMGLLPVPKAGYYDGKGKFVSAHWKDTNYGNPELLVDGDLSFRPYASFNFDTEDLKYNGGDLIPAIVFDLSDDPITLNGLNIWSYTTELWMTDFHVEVKTSVGGEWELVGTYKNVCNNDEYWLGGDEFMYYFDKTVTAYELRLIVDGIDGLQQDNGEYLCVYQLYEIIPMVVKQTAEPKPTEPTDAPTEPTQAPTTAPTEAPTTNPTEPSVMPTDPTEAPTDPGEDTTDPTAPGEPTDDPVDPTEAPGEPSDDVTEPSDVVTDPTDEPTAEPSATDPTTAATDPSQNGTDAPENTTAPTTNTAEPGSSEKSGNAGLIVVIVLLVAAAAGAAVVIIKKKKG